MSIYPDQKYLHDKALVELLTKALCEPAGISGSMFAISELEVNVDDEDVREVGLEIGFNPFQTDEGEVRPETGWFNFRLDKDSGEWSLLMGEDGDDEADITAAALYAVLYFSSAGPATALTQQEAEPVASVPQDVEEWIAENEIVDMADSRIMPHIVSSKVRTFLAQRDAGCVRVPDEVVIALSQGAPAHGHSIIIGSHHWNNIKNWVKSLAASKEGV